MIKKKINYKKIKLTKNKKIKKKEKNKIKMHLI